MTQSNSMHPVVLLPTSAPIQQQSQPTRWLDGQSAYTASEVAPQQQQYVTPASGIQPGMTRGGAGGGRGGGGRPCFNVIFLLLSYHIILIMNLLHLF
jgi:hypothetical protein